MQIILYTAPVDIENEIEIIQNTLDAGVDYLYIRKPELDDFSLVDFVEKIPEKYWNKCISSSLIITKEFNLGGYHFTRDIIEKNEKYNDKVLEWLHTNNKICSVSAHNENEILTYSNKFNHVIVSPIFKSISKQNYSYEWNFDELKQNIATIKMRKNNIQLFAVGGIDINNITLVKQLGFNGVGLLGAIWNASFKAQNELISIIETIKK